MGSPYAGVLTDSIAIRKLAICRANDRRLGLAGPATSRCQDGGRWRRNKCRLGFSFAPRENLKVVLNIGVVQQYAKGKCGSVPTSVPPKYSCIGVVSLNILICLFLLAATLFFLATYSHGFCTWDGLFSCPDCGGRAEVSLRTL